MRFRWIYTALTAALVLTLLAPTASAQDFNKIYAKVKKLQEKGKHQKALKLIDKKLKADTSPNKPVLMATSMAATDRAAEAFRMLVPYKNKTLPKKHLNLIGATLPTHMVKFRSKPEGADVTVDGKSVGTTPLDAQLKPGFRTVVISRKGYGSHSKTIFVDPDQAGYLTAPLKAKTGTVKVKIDQNGVRVTFAGQDKKLDKGTHTFTKIAAGTHQVTFYGPDGSKGHTASITVPAGGDTSVSWTKFGVVLSKFADATVELVPEKKEDDDEDKDKNKPKAEKELRLVPGNYTVLVKRPGHFPLKGKLTVAAGQRQTLVNDHEAIPDRSQVEIWSVVGVSTSLAMIATAVVLELSDVDEDGGGGIAKFTLAGVGGALFVTSGALLKWVRDERANPGAKDATFNVKLGAGFLKDGGLITARGTF